jgi:hypothetical protein
VIFLLGLVEIGASVVFRSTRTADASV